MPVKKADAKRKKALKILLFGDGGVGKTHFALQATPGATLIFDAESGADFFEGKTGFNFDYWVDDDGQKTASIKELHKAIDYLDSPNGKKQFKTFVIDPVSDIWDNIQAQRGEYKEVVNSRKIQKYRKEYINELDVDAFNQKDWGDMKRVYKSIMLRLKNLTQNVILIAREKEIVETKDNGEMLRTGEYTYDAEKNSKYAVDFVVRLAYDERTKRRTAYVNKTRSEGIEKGDKIDNPTFALFDKVVNAMSGGKEATTISDKAENVFQDETTDNTENDVTVLISQIAEIATELPGLGVEKSVIADTVKANFNFGGKPNANYNKITDTATAEAVLAALQILQAKVLAKSEVGGNAGAAQGNDDAE